MFINNIFNINFRSSQLLCFFAGVAFFLIINVPLLYANCECNDGYCDSVSSTYFEFGDTITESCTFTADVTRPAGNTGGGFTIAGPNIVVDGDGHILDGVSTANATVGTNGIFANSYYGSHNGTIKNLEIKNFWQGIKLRGGSGAISGWLIDNCTVHDNGELGHFAKYEGIWLDVAENCVVQNCKIYNNMQGSGIANGESDSNSFINNEIYGNYKHGIKAWWDSWYLYAGYNYVHDNGWGGINHKSGSNYGTIEYNTSTDNTGPGIQGGIGNYFIGNISSDNVSGSDINPETGLPYDHGIGIDCNPGDIGNAYVEDNLVCGNEEYDIYMGEEVNGIGYYNTCNTTYNFNDSGYDGCTYLCETGFPVAKFYADDTMTCDGTSTQFYDQSLYADGSTLSWDWNFGDGSAHSYAENPQHTYASGIYTVTLTITMTGSQSGTDTITKEDYITVCPYPGDLEPSGTPDGDVDGSDFQYFYANCLASGPAGWCDINGDSNVNGDDMATLGLMDCLSCP